MKKPKRILAFLVSCSMMFALGACSGPKEDGTQPGNSQPTLAENAENWLPFGLQFGQSYDEFAEAVTSSSLEVPALEPAESNNGYVTEGLYLSNVAAESFLDYGVYCAATGDKTMEDQWDSFYFSFNQDQELYEWYWMTTTSARDTDDVIEAMIATYNEKFGFDGTVNDSSDVCAIWESERLAANIQTNTSQNGTDIVTLVIHSFEYDLNS